MEIQAIYGKKGGKESALHVQGHRMRDDDPKNKRSHNILLPTLNK